MKKWIVYLSCLMAGVGGFAGCSEDKYEGPHYFLERQNEKILYELVDEPGFVHMVREGYVFVSCSKYVDEFLAYPPDDFIPISSSESLDRITYPKDTTIIYDREYLYFMLYDICKKEYGIYIDDFKEFDIPLGAKIYITASVTDNRVVESNGDEQYKVYVHDLRMRE